MHEMALADAVVRSVRAEAARAGIARLTRVVVRVGELQSISIETFDSLLRELLPAGDALVAGARVEVELERAAFRCRPCGREFSLADVPGPADERESEAIHFVPELAHGFMACPACGSPDFEVRQGRGVVLQTLEGEGEGPT